MPKSFIQIDNLNSGIPKDNMKGNGLAMVYGCDIYSQPGLIHSSKKSFPNTNKVSTIASPIMGFEDYYYDGITYTLAYTAGGDIYYYRTTAPAGWVLIGTFTGGFCGYMKTFGDKLYFTTTAYLGELSGDPLTWANWNQTWNSLYMTVTVSEPSYLCEFDGDLYVANRRWIGKLYGDGSTWVDDALVLPEGSGVNMMCKWNNKLIISANTTSPISPTVQPLAENTSSVYFWDGITSSYEQKIDVPPRCNIVFNYNETLFIFVNNTIYVYNGADFESYREIPSTRISYLMEGEDPYILPNAILNYRDNMLFGFYFSGGSTYLINGLYSFANLADDYGYSLSIPYIVAGSSDINIYAIFNSKRLGVLVSHANLTGSTAYNIASETASKLITGPLFITTPIIVGDQFGKLVQGVRLDFADTFAADDAVNVYYRINEQCNGYNFANDWVLLGSIIQGNYDQVLYGINKRAKTIQFRFNLESSVNVDNPGPTIRKINIY